jgi:4-hydroxy-tetrahydrodipicolinate synthase
VILYPPSLVPPGDRQLLNYFKTIASTVNVPIMIQDAPRTTGVTMSTAFLLSAFEKIENLKFAKIECPLPVQKIAEIGRATNQQLRCMSGNGGIFTIDAFMRGAWGVMPGIGVIDYFVKLFDRFDAGEVSKSRDIFENLMPLLWFEDQSLEFFIACEKEILSQKQVIRSSRVRDPGFTADKSTLDELKVLLQRLNPNLLRE